MGSDMTKKNNNNNNDDGAEASMSFDQLEREEQYKQRALQES
jgi:hypothetical protein